MAHRNDEVVELTLVLFHETEKAFLVGNTGERDKAVWLAKSLVDMEVIKGSEAETVSGVTTTRELDIYEFLVPERLANERGLL